MKKKIFTLLALAAMVLSTQNASATIRRVGYTGTALLNTDYADLQSAHDAAAAGDTILLFPGYYSASYSKKLITIGYGYYNDTLALGTGANAGLQNIKGTLSFNVYLYASAANSVFEGTDGGSITAYYGEAVNNITIRRCRGYINFNNMVCNNWVITQSQIDNLGFMWAGGTPTNLTVSNCFISGLALSNGSGITQTGQFTNNTIYEATNLGFGNGSFVLKNNIFLLYHGADANCVAQNNIYNTGYSAGPAGNGNVNIDNASMNTIVFEGYNVVGTTYSIDGRYALKPGSPAIGAGAGGIDCGMYGGTNPYKLSGMPRIPAFYKLTAPSNITSTNPYTITFSVRSNN